MKAWDSGSGYRNIESLRGSGGDFFVSFACGVRELYIYIYIYIYIDLRDNQVYRGLHPKTLLGGSWVVISRVISPLIWVIT